MKVTPEGLSRIASNSALPSGVTGPPDGVGIGHRRLLRQAPDRRRTRHTVRQCGTECFVENVGKQLGHGRVGTHRAEERLGEGLPALSRRLLQWPQIRVIDHPECANQPSPDLGLRQCSGQRVEQRPTQLKTVVRELEIEEGGFRLLELGRCRQHVVGESGGLGHRDVDDDHQFQRLERLPARRRIGQRMSGIAALDDHRPEAVGVVGQNLLGHGVGRYQSGDDGRAGNRSPAGDRTEQRRKRRMQVLATLFREVAGEDPQQLVEIRAQRAVRSLLHTQVFEHRDAAGGCDAPRRCPQQLLVHPAALRVIGDRNVTQRGADDVGAMHVLRQKRFVAQVFLDEDGGQRRQAPSVGARKHPQVEVGHLGGVGDDGIDDDHRPGRVFGNLVEYHPRSRKALRHPRVLADEHRHLGVLELAAGVTAVELRIDPCLAGLLLRQCVGTVLCAQSFQERPAVGPAQVIALPAAAVVEDLVAAVGVANVLETLGDLDNRCVPVDFLEGAVGAAPHRRGQASAIVLVMVQPQGLVAGVALRPRMLLVASDAGQCAVFDLNDDAAVALAEDARGGLPIGGGHPGFPSGSSAESRLRSWRCNDVQRRQVAPHPGQQKRALEGRRCQHRQLCGPVRRYAVGDEALGDQVRPAVEHRRGALDHRAIRSRSSARRPPLTQPRSGSRRGNRCRAAAGGTSSISVSSNPRLPSASLMMAAMCSPA